MAKFVTEQPCFFKNGYRPVGTIIELECTKGKDGKWEGKEPPEPWMKEYKGPEPAAPEGPPPKGPKKNP